MCLLSTCAHTSTVMYGIAIINGIFLHLVKIPVLLAHHQFLHHQYPPLQLQTVSASEGTMCMRFTKTCCEHNFKFRTDLLLRIQILDSMYIYIYIYIYI